MSNPSPGSLPSYITTLSSLATSFVAVDDSNQGIISYTSTSGPICNICIGSIPSGTNLYAILVGSGGNGGTGNGSGRGGGGGSGGAIGFINLTQLLAGYSNDNNDIVFQLNGSCSINQDTTLDIITDCP